MGLLKLFGWHRKFRAHNLGELIWQLTQHRAFQVIASTIEVRERRLLGGSTRTVGYIGDFEFRTRYWCILPNGDGIVYVESYGDQAKRWGSSRGFADHDDRDRLLLSLLLTQRASLATIKEALPNIVTEIEFPPGLMPYEFAESLTYVASNTGARPFLIPVGR